MVAADVSAISKLRRELGVSAFLRDDSVLRDRPYPVDVEPVLRASERFLSEESLLAKLDVLVEKILILVRERVSDKHHVDSLADSRRMNPGHLSVLTVVR